MNYLEFLQEFRALVEKHPKWNSLSQTSKTAIMKMAMLIWRVFAGQPNYWGVWFDIEVTARKTKEKLQDEKNPV
jgi:hypothetical protein